MAAENAPVDLKKFLSICLNNGGVSKDHEVIEV